jgi:hypothetical protein
MRTGKRDVGIDLIRGYCIASMVTGHIAAFSFLAALLHVFPKFDGASGFVLLSGLVLGIVQARRLERVGLAAVERETVKRTAQIYGIQLLLSVVGVISVVWGGWEHETFPPALEQMRPLEIIGGVLSMNIAPPGGDVLRLYVVFLLLATGAYVLLARGRWLLVLATSGGIAVLGYAFPHATSFSLFGGAPSASWAGWQLLFFSALVLGWHWERLNAADWLTRNGVRVMIGSILIVVGTAALSLFWPHDELLFSKYTFPPGRILTAYAVVAALYVVATWISRLQVFQLLRPLYMAGQRSLDSYAIQSVATTVVVGIIGLHSTSLAAQGAALGVIVLCWAWAEARSRGKRRDSKGSPRASDSVA